MIARALAAAALLLAACGGSGSGSGADGGSDAAIGSPCSGSAAAAGVFDRTIDVRGTQRSYILAVPSGYDGSRPLALIFAWHGRGSNSAQARAYFGVEAAAGDEAILVYPQGLEITATPGDTGWDLGADSVDTALFDAVLDTVAADYCIDRDRVFSTGHSYGGFMTNTLGCQRSSVLRGIAPVAGGGPYGSCEGGAMASMVVHGSMDMIVPVAMGEGSRDHWLSAAGCAATTTATDPSPCVAYDGCAEPVWWCEHDETALSGHTWPTFAGAGIWSFFVALPAR